MEILACLISERADRVIGPVTDYGSSMLQWMRTRRPRYKGAHRMEAERPSASYVVDVRYFCLDLLGVSN